MNKLYEQIMTENEMIVYLDDNNELEQQIEKNVTSTTNEFIEDSNEDSNEDSKEQIVVSPSISVKNESYKELLDKLQPKGGKFRDQDFTQRISIAFTVLLELYRAITSSLLILFVPQNCSTIPGTQSVCSLSENMIWDSQMLYNVTLVFNFVNLSAFLLFYYIELVRENRLVKYLDVNGDVPNEDDDVAEALALLPNDKRDKIVKIDQYYQRISYFSMVLYFLNVILSGFVVKQYYLNNQTSSTFVTYVLFMLLKLSNVYTISNTKKHTFYSAYLKTHVQYNDVDRKYRIPISA